MVQIKMIPLRVNLKLSIMKNSRTVLVESIKEQQEQINQLKLEVEELKNGQFK